LAPVFPPISRVCGLTFWIPAFLINLFFQFVSAFFPFRFLDQRFCLVSVPSALSFLLRVFQFFSVPSPHAVSVYCCPLTKFLTPFPPTFFVMAVLHGLVSAFISFSTTTLTSCSPLFHPPLFFSRNFISPFVYPPILPNVFRSFCPSGFSLLELPPSSTSLFFSPFALAWAVLSFTSMPFF